MDLALTASVLGCSPTSCWVQTDVSFVHQYAWYRYCRDSIFLGHDTSSVRDVFLCGSGRFDIDILQSTRSESVDHLLNFLESAI